MKPYEIGILFFTGSFVGWMVWALISILWEIRRNPEDFDPPTKELYIAPTMRIGPRFEEFGPGKPVPPSAEQLNELWERS